MDRLESKLHKNVRLYRINIHSKSGIYLSELIGNRSVPTFVLFDRFGNPVMINHKVPSMVTINEALGLSISN